MDYVYVCQQGATLHLKENQIHVCKDEERIKTIPIFPVKVIDLFGNINMTVNLERYCMDHDIAVIYYSQCGRYIGRLSGNREISKINRILDQVHLCADKDFSMTLAESIIKGKLHNQLTVARRYADDARFSKVEEAMSQIKKNKEKIDSCNSIDQIRGYEGRSARLYFCICRRLIL